MIYLASPYTHRDPQVREQRFRAACQATAALIRAGAVVFSPICHSHPLADHGLPTEWSFWERFDREYLARCDLLLVLKLEGWTTSVGVQAEMRIARELGKPICFLGAPPTAFHSAPTLAHVRPTAES